MSESRRFLETADLARTFALTPAAIRYHVEQGHIRPVAWTARGTALFNEEAVEALRRHRAIEHRGRPRRA